MILYLHFVDNIGSQTIYIKKKKKKNRDEKKEDRKKEREKENDQEVCADLGSAD